MISLFDVGHEVRATRAALDAAFDRVVGSNRFVLGPEVEAFEAEMAARLDARHAVGVSCGSDALMLALAALGVGPGSEVVTSAFGFIATAGSIARLGATAVFVDLQPGAFFASPSAIAKAVTRNTRAVVHAHLFGSCDGAAELADAARAAGVPLVEDAAQAFGNPEVGRHGVAATLSFFPTKPLGGLGDGGLVATNDAALAARVRRLRQHGTSDRRHYAELGGNHRLDALQAALLGAKLPHVDGWRARRAEIAARYDAALSGRGDWVLPRPDRTSAWALYTLRSPRRDALAAQLRAQGVESGIYYPEPLSSAPALAGRARRSMPLPEVERACREVLSVPAHAGLSDADVERVLAALG